MPDSLDTLTAKSARGQEALERYAKATGRMDELEQDPSSVLIDLIEEILHAAPIESAARALRLANAQYEAEAGTDPHRIVPLPEVGGDGSPVSQ